MIPSIINVGGDSQAMKWVKIGIAFILAILLIILIKKFVLKSEEDKKADELGDTKGLNPDFLYSKEAQKSAYKKLGKKEGSQLYQSDLKKLVPSINDFPSFVKALFDAKDTFNDDEESIYGVFRRFRSQFEIAFFTKLFYATYKKDLYMWLKDFMNNEELAVIYDITKKKKLV